MLANLAASIVVAGAANTACTDSNRKLGTSCNLAQINRLDARASGTAAALSVVAVVRAAAAAATGDDHFDLAHRIDFHVRACPTIPPELRTVVSMRKAACCQLNKTRALYTGAVPRTP